MFALRCLIMSDMERPLLGAKRPLEAASSRSEYLWAW
jgi:hypothetical protein